MIFLGIDIGSTTVKVVGESGGKVIFKAYERHHSLQRDKLLSLLKRLRDEIGDCELKVTFTGSGGKIISDQVELPFLQEVVCANLAIKDLTDHPGTTIEIGGQDSKFISYRYDGDRSVGNIMRMNNSCAGGTGAFLDEISSLLKVQTSDLNKLASAGKHIHNISGRCGVFAKTDIQPLINNGVSREDIALSAYNAVAKQVINSLGRGSEINSPLILCGGPIAFSPTLVEIFREVTSASEVVVPKGSEYLVANGALIESRERGGKSTNIITLIEELESFQSQTKSDSLPPLFRDSEELSRFRDRVRSDEIVKPLDSGDLYLGIDAGSTTSKFVLLNNKFEVVYHFYKDGDGDPIGVLKRGLIEAKQYVESKGYKFNILAAGSTGYGEQLIKKGFRCDYSEVETIAHFRAAKQYCDNLSFILDIGGQDMKAIYVESGTITEIVLNEACSAGCGSFLETYSDSIGVPISEYADYSFRSKSPANLGSRCTVFINSSIITQQREGRSKEDILAGLSISIIKNLFSRILRGSRSLGDGIVVQGGTFKNDAVLRTFETYLGKEVIRSPYPGVMGAIGVAILAAENQKGDSSFISNDLEKLSYKHLDESSCKLCSNNCSLHTIRFGHGSSHTTGNRCERGEVDHQSRSDLDIFNGYQLKSDILSRYGSRSNSSKITIGIPLVFQLHNSLPFWRVVFDHLGFNIVVTKGLSKRSERATLTIPSETVCYPAKIVHRYVDQLIGVGVTHIFLPMIHKVEPLVPSTQAHYICSVVQGYPITIKHNMDHLLKDIELLTPQFHFFTDKARVKQSIKFLSDSFGISKKVATEAVYRGVDEYKSVKREILDGFNSINRSKQTIIVAGRPYHGDPIINQEIPRLIAQLGFNVVSLENLPNLEKYDLSEIRAETDIGYQDLIYRGALFCRDNNPFHMVQIVSFGCGHDAIISDEVERVLKQSRKQLLVLKTDETISKNSILIRLRSFLETIGDGKKVESRVDPFPLKFGKEDRTKRTILIPNISESFGKLSSGVMSRSGYSAKALPFPDSRVFEVGKLYTNNDLCFPVQLIVGDAIHYIKEQGLDPKRYAFSVPKIKGDCRLAQYSMISRKAFDDAGLDDLAIITTGDDTKGLHPGFVSDTKFQVRMLYAVVVHDIIELIFRKSRCYEKRAGESELLFNSYIDRFERSFEQGRKVVLQTLRSFIDDFNRIGTYPFTKERIFITGEVMLKHHHTGNRDIERYLEGLGYEVIVSSMLPVLNKDYIEIKRMKKQFNLPTNFVDAMVNSLSIKIIDFIFNRCEKIFRGSKFYSKLPNYYGYQSKYSKFFDSSYAAGEGCLIPSEIIFNIEDNIKKFIIVQPFGCMPNHITGRGLEKPIQAEYKDVKILSLDYDPDTSYANIENRILMFLND